MGDISDAFDIDYIDEQGVGLTEDEDQELTTWLEEVVGERLHREEQTADMATVEEIVVSIAAMSFVAGRAYQEDLHDDSWTVSMPRRMHDLFIEFLAERVQL